MLFIEIFRYLKRRADKRPYFLENFVDQSHHHGTRNSEPSIAIIIPTRDKASLLRACVESIFEKTSYANYKLIIVDNQSVEPATHEYLSELENRDVRILRFPHKFNYSAICNLAAVESEAEYLCFLNNDVQVIEPNWLDYLIDHAVADSIGVVGALLLYPNGHIQHTGIAIGYRGVAGHPFVNEKYMQTKHDRCFSVSGVTFACAVVNRETFLAHEGLDVRLRIGLNDVEFCMRLHDAGKQNVVCQKALLTHFESMSRKRMSHPTGFIQASLEVLWFIRNSKKTPGDEFFS